MTGAAKLDAEHEVLWHILGGQQGLRPPLVVSKELYDVAIAAGYPADRLKVQETLPGSK